MKNAAWTILVLGLVFMLVAAPFSALAGAMLALLLSAIAWAFWNLVRVAVEGESSAD